MANCYEILGDTAKAKFYLGQINEEDNERTYERAQNRLTNLMSEFDVLYIKAENLKECNQFDLSLASLNMSTELKLGSSTTLPESVNLVFKNTGSSLSRK